MFPSATRELKHQLSVLRALCRLSPHSPEEAVEKLGHLCRLPPKPEVMEVSESASSSSFSPSAYTLVDCVCAIPPVHTPPQEMHSLLHLLCFQWAVSSSAELCARMAPVVCAVAGVLATACATRTVPSWELGRLLLLLADACGCSGRRGAEWEAAAAACGVVVDSAVRCAVGTVAVWVPSAAALVCACLLPITNV